MQSKKEEKIPFFETNKIENNLIKKNDKFFQCMANECENVDIIKENFQEDKETLKNYQKDVDFTQENILRINVGGRSAQIPIKLVI